MTDSQVIINTFRIKCGSSNHGVDEQKDRRTAVPFLLRVLTYAGAIPTKSDRNTQK